MSIISWGKPKVEVTAHVGGVQPQKSFTLVKANLIADTSIEIAKNSGIVSGDVIGYGSTSVACTAVVQTDPLKDVVTVTMGQDIANGVTLYEAAAVSAGAAVEKATWIEFPVIVEKTAQLNTEKGAKSEALGEGGEVVDTRYQKNKYSFECELFVKKGDAKPIVDNDGLIVTNFMARLTPEDNTLEGWLMETTAVSIVETWSSEIGKKWKYTFDGVKPANGNILKPYKKA